MSLTEDLYTMDIKLCDDGIVRGGAMHHGTDYTCTGHAHYAGEHMRCTNAIHSVPASTCNAPPTFHVPFKNLEDGLALVRVVRELREHFAGEEVPQDFLDDLATVERVGKWLGTTAVITSDSLNLPNNVSFTTMAAQAGQPTTQEEQ